ncbi:MAG: DUF5615 family PIN-like protein [Bacteroidota bacterium]|nr:DUF5615 family PIN-like protein [Bacteroidota bacterium]
MNFKLDENLGNRFKKLFTDNEFEADTVHDEQLQGSVDYKIYETIIKEEKCLVTLDLDFSDVTRFPPQTTKGIVIIRLHKKFTYELASILISQFIDVIKNNKTNEKLSGKLWIVEFGRIRIHQS